MSAPTPAQIALIVNNDAERDSFKRQAARITAELDRRTRARSKGMKGPLTRAEMAAMAQRGQTPQNGRRRG